MKTYKLKKLLQAYMHAIEMLCIFILLIVIENYTNLCYYMNFIFKL